MHAKLRAPIDLNSESTLNINTQSALAKVIRQAKLLIWEEAVMHSVHLLNAVHRSLCDVRGLNPDDSANLLGRMLVVMAGDLCAHRAYSNCRNVIRLACLLAL